jgi:hypothetical protein
MLTKLLQNAVVSPGSPATAGRPYSRTCPPPAAPPPKTTASYFSVSATVAEEFAPPTPRAGAPAITAIFVATYVVFLYDVNHAYMGSVNFLASLGYTDGAGHIHISNNAVLGVFGAAGTLVGSTGMAAPSLIVTGYRNGQYVFALAS